MTASSLFNRCRESNRYQLVEKVLRCKGNNVSRIFYCLNCFHFWVECKSLEGKEYHLIQTYFVPDFQLASRECWENEGLVQKFLWIHSVPVFGFWEFGNEGHFYKKVFYKFCSAIQNVTILKINEGQYYSVSSLQRKGFAEYIM